jgi:AcrR family transcriptional regulator
MAKPERRNLSAERQAEILEAFKRCIVEHGLDKSSMRLVAAEAGVSQPLLAHHFGSRAGLVEALVSHAVGEYDEALARALERFSQEGGTEVLLEYLFGGPYSEATERNDVLFHELFAAATRDRAIRKQLGSSYARFQRDLANHLGKTHPEASASECRCVAYGLMCLAESNELLRAIDLPGRHSRDATESGRTLIRSLTKQRS